jgi:hypothetical protein
MAEIPDGSIDLIVTSPPFLALRSYLPADHPDKAREIGSEATPAAFIDTLLALTAEWGRVLAPHGSLCVELGDTYYGSGGAGGDYNAGGMRDGQGKFDGSASRGRREPWGVLTKSMTMIPTLFPASLAYGRNLLTGQPSPAGQWRIRNMIVWARPNPPVGALGDKFRPATSYITVACRGARRYFDLDAVRTPITEPSLTRTRSPSGRSVDRDDRSHVGDDSHPAGAPPLDWHADHHPEDGDWLWKLSTQPYSGFTPTVRRVPCGPDDGGERTASVDCPRHGDLPGQVPKALRDERADSRTSRTRHNGGHPELTLDLVDVSSDATRDRSGSAHAPTTATLGPECSPAATSRSTSSSRTGRAPATTQPDTPSARTAHHTACTPASPASTCPDPDMPESSISSDDSGASLAPRMTDDSVDIARSERPCTCSFYKTVVESTSHYATFPMALPKRLIEAMCPLRVCTVCGRPSERIVDHVRTVNGAATPHGKSAGALHSGGPMTTDFMVLRSTLGWTDCGCSQIFEATDTWRTGVVLDPFAGSGTTLEAAQAVGRHAIGIDLDARNADLAQSRVGMFLTVEGAA